MTEVWVEIHGFSSPGEYERFFTYIEKQVAAGIARERMVDPGYERDKINGGRWFEDLDTKTVWRLVPPDFPFKGLWERIDRGAAKR
jgi:hypothetical protein